MDLLNYLVRSPRGALPVVSRHQPQVVGNENGNYAGISPASASMQSDRNTAAQPAPVAKSVGILSFEEWAATSEATAGSVTPPDVNAVGTLHMLCTRCGVVPEFTLTESPLYSFHAKLVLGNQTIEGHGPFSSKKEAKKYVAAQGIPILQALLDAEKRAAAVQQHELKRGSSCAGSVDGDAQENWVGILHGTFACLLSPSPEMKLLLKYTRLEFCQGTHITLPRYSFAQPVQSAFTCTISLSPWPTLVFGDVNRVHPAKKAAKSVAAQAAVDWLRAEGHMQGNEPARKKLCTESSAASDGDGADVVQATLKGPSCAQQVVGVYSRHVVWPLFFDVERADSFVL